MRAIQSPIGRESHSHPAQDLPTGRPALLPTPPALARRSTDGQPIILTIHPDLLRAAKRHLRLRAQRGTQPTTAGVSTATRIIWFRYRRNAAVPNPLQQRWANRHTTLTPNLHGHVLITRYPEIITLATMITSPYTRDKKRKSNAAPGPQPRHMICTNAGHRPDAAHLSWLMTQATDRGPATASALHSMRAINGDWRCQRRDQRAELLGHPRGYDSNTAGEMGADGERVI